MQDYAEVSRGILPMIGVGLKEAIFALFWALRGKLDTMRLECSIHEAFKEVGVSDPCCNRMKLQKL